MRRSAASPITCWISSSTALMPPMSLNLTCRRHQNTTKQRLGNSTFGVVHGPKASSSPTSPAKPTRLRLRSVATVATAAASSAARSVRGRLAASSRDEEAAARMGGPGGAGVEGAGVEGATAAVRLRCCRVGSLRTSSSILRGVRRSLCGWKGDQGDDILGFTDIRLMA